MDESHPPPLCCQAVLHLLHLCIRNHLLELYLCTENQRGQKKISELQKSAGVLEIVSVPAPLPFQIQFVWKQKWQRHDKLSTPCQSKDLHKSPVCPPEIHTFTTFLCTNMAVQLKYDTRETSTNLHARCEGSIDFGNNTDNLSNSERDIHGRFFTNNMIIHNTAFSLFTLRYYFKSTVRKLTINLGRLSSLLNMKDYRMKHI